MIVAIRRVQFLIVLLFVVVRPGETPASANDTFSFQDNRTLNSGLIAEYATPPFDELSRHVRIDSDVQFSWRKASPDLRIPKGLFRVTWQGTLSIPETGTYQLHLRVIGKARLSIGNKHIVEGHASEMRWLQSGHLSLERGYHAFQLVFEKTEPTAEIGLYWQSNHFSLEPITSQWFFHSSGTVQTKSNFETGRQQIRSYRCAACHDLSPSRKSLPAPALEHVSDTLNSEWLSQWLKSPKTMDPETRMPSFDLSDAEIIAISNYLKYVSTPVEGPSPDTNIGSVQQGREHFQSLGCLACHKAEEKGTRSLFGGGSLDRLAEKRPFSFLQPWLSNPAALNRSHRMPVFDLADEEIADLSAYLYHRAADIPSSAQPSPDKANPETNDTIAYGKKLLHELRCAACHTIPGIRPPMLLPRLRIEATSEIQGCLSSAKRSAKQPGFELNPLKRKSLMLFIRGLPEQHGLAGTYEWGRQLIQESNCLNCHSRGLESGLTIFSQEKDTGLPDLPEHVQQRALSEAPSLNAIGDKFHTPVLQSLIQGGTTPHRPWLKIRMPRFRHSPEALHAITDFFVRHDRLQLTESPLVKTAPRLPDKNDANLLNAGQQLVSSRGFGCMSCHTLGRHRPEGIAANARGSDLLQLGKRLRQSWFRRWLNNPTRMVVGMEMPAVNVAVPGVLESDLGLQVEALWQSLNHSSFVIPSDKQWAENILSLREDDRSVVLRDVMHEAPPGSSWCARGLSLALPNRNNFLFDLETMSLRSWWLGDFAHERTQGKIWMWEPAGLPVWTHLPRLATVALSKRDDGTLIFAEKKGQTVGWLEGWEIEHEQVHFSYRIRFLEKQWIHVKERIRPIHLSGQHGFSRNLSITGVPKGYEVLILQEMGRQESRSPSSSEPLKNEDLSVLTGNGPLGDYHVRSVSNFNWKRVSSIQKTDPNLAAYGLSLRKQTQGRNPGVYTINLQYLTDTAPLMVTNRPDAISHAETIPQTSNESAPVALEVAPGFEVTRLPLPSFVMPTAIAFRPDGTPVVCSLKGEVFLATDQDGDGWEDTWKTFSDHLAAPFGVLTEGNSVIVSHKPELLELIDHDGDGRADRTKVIATGWGYNDNYHDWTFGLVRDDRNQYYVTLGSDYQQKDRPDNASFLRGHALRIRSNGEIDDVASGLRFAAGINRNLEGAIFFTDNQGVQNTFNEINHLIPNSRYGVPAKTDNGNEVPMTPLREPAIYVPHPLTRSVNGLCFLESHGRFAEFEGHGIGCEYDTRALLRFSLQKIGNTYQGACYRFTLPEQRIKSDALLGPICSSVAPNGDLYIGSFRDSGWGAGNNIGELVRIRRKGPLPLGIREVRATDQGFVIDFTGAVVLDKAMQPDHYGIVSYQRVWKGGYATADGNRRSESVIGIRCSDDRRSIILTLKQLRAGFLYDIHVGPIGIQNAPLWPADAYYTLNEIPEGPSLHP